MIVIFVFGCFITLIAAAACAVIVAGIRADKRELEELGEQGSGSKPSTRSL